MAIDWKKSGQDKALEFIDKDMLVSASAGSGKTTVMVEKILRYLEKGSITRIIVLTFTKASAADMREKLTEKLSERIRLGGENAAHYREQLRALPFAYIGTIDAICAQIYKRYFEVIGGSPTLDLLGEEEAKAMRSLAMDEVFNSLIKSGDDTFNEIATLYGSSKSFDRVKDTIDVILNSLSAQEAPEEFLSFARAEAKKPFLASGAIKTHIAYFRKSFGALLPFAEEMVRLATEVEDATDKEKALNYAKATELDDICSAVVHSSDEGFVALMSTPQIRLNMPPRTKAGEHNRKYLDELGEINEKVKTLLARGYDVFGKGLDECEREDKSSGVLVCRLLDIVSLVRSRYSELKREEGKQDFEDVERATLEIFASEAIAKEFSEGIDYIFLDEYQDTNKLQEAIFAKISRANLFMVGDVKQAIYGFREAEPQIFLDKFERYQTGEDGKNVPLNKNFRSSQEVLSFVDNVFGEVMSYDFGGIDYKKEAMFGEAGLEVAALPMKGGVEVAVFPKKEKEKKEPDTFVYSVREGRRAVDEDLSEDNYIARKIKELVGKEEIFDKALGRVRPLSYGDIAVLYRTRAASDGTRRVFDREAIPYRAEGFKGATDASDTDAINSYLRVLDNFKQDYPLAGAMLSHFGGFTEGELAEIRKQGYGQRFFYEAVESYEGALKPRIDDFLSGVAEYKKLSALVSVPTLIGKIMTDTGYLTALLAEGRTDRIDYYNAFIRTLRTKKFASDLRSYVEFLDSGVELDIAEPQKALDAVTLMTVHKSKGLEFPVVFVAHCGTDMNKRIEGQTVVIDTRYGLGMNDFDLSSGKTIKTARRRAIEKAILEKQNFEALRLMYVAFTRAKCRLYVSGEAALDEDGFFKNASGIMLRGQTKFDLPSELETFMDWVIYAATRNPAIKIKKEDRAGEPEAEEAPPKQEEFSVRAGTPLSFMSYPYDPSTAVSNKYTVTSLNVRDEEEQVYIPSLVSQSAEKGIAYHKVMELIDFNARDLDAIRTFVDSLEAEGVIERGYVDPRIIKKSLDHPLFDAVRAGKALREQEFIYYAPACEVLEGVSASDKVLVQGVMDLIVEGEESLLIDYKVSGAPIDTLKERYRRQVELYARSYEEMSGKKLARKAVFVLNRGEVIEF